MELDYSPPQTSEVNQIFYFRTDPKQNLRQNRVHYILVHRPLPRCVRVPRMVRQGSHPAMPGMVTRPALPPRARSRFLCLRAVACQDRLAPTTTSVGLALGCASRVTVLLGRVHHPTPCRLNAISSWACSARARLKASIVPCTSLRSTWASANVSCRRMLFPASSSTNAPCTRVRFIC